MKFLAVIAGLLLLSSGPVFGDPGGKKDSARTDIRNAVGQTVGVATFSEVGVDGTGTLRATIPGLTLRIYTPTAIFSPIGAAVLIHAAPDDEMTDPDGNSGME